MFSAIGVDTDFMPGSIERVILPAHEPRFAPLAWLAQKISDEMRRHGQQRAVGYLKQRSWLEAILFKKADAAKYQVTAAERNLLKDYYRDEIVLFAEQIDRPLPEIWQENYDL